MAGEIEYALGTVERVRCEISSKTRTGAELVTLDVELAIIPFGQTPGDGDWQPAVWESVPGANKAVARLVHTFDETGKLGVHSRLDDSPELVIKHAGSIMVRN